MKDTRVLMGMPVAVEVVDAAVTRHDIDEVYRYFQYVDDKFSTYKENSEISKINRGELAAAQSSTDMQTVLALAEQTRIQTNGYFDIRCDGQIDPSGIVKGWAILNAAEILRARGFRNFYVDAGGDAEVAGTNAKGQTWRVGIRNPFNPTEIVKVLALSDGGIATSGTYVRGQHIYNPKAPGRPITDIAGITVVGPNVYQADRFATAAFAMGREGIYLIERLEGFEGYMIDAQGRATLTSGLEKYLAHEMD